MQKMNCAVVITLLLLTRAAHSEIWPVSVGGDCGSQVSHHEEVWFIAPFNQCDPPCLYVVFLHAAASIISMFIFVRIACLCVDLQKASQRLLCTKSDEVRLAEEAFKKYVNPAPTIFSKVIDRSIPADIIYEDEKVPL